MAGRPQWYLSLMGSTKRVQPYWRLATIDMEMTPRKSCHQRPRVPESSILVVEHQHDERSRQRITTRMGILLGRSGWRPKGRRRHEYPVQLGVERHGPSTRPGSHVGNDPERRRIVLVDDGQRSVAVGAEGKL